MINIQLQANDYNRLIKMPRLPLFLMTQAELNKFELEIDWTNMLYWSIIFSMGIVCTIFNTPIAPLIQKTFKLGNNSSFISTLNLRKRTHAVFNSLFDSHFFFFYASKIKKLETAFAGIEKAAITKNPYFPYKQTFLELIYQQLEIDQ